MTKQMRGLGERNVNASAQTTVLKLDQLYAVHEPTEPSQYKTG